MNRGRIVLVTVAAVCAAQQAAGIPGAAAAVRSASVSAKVLTTPANDLNKPPTEIPGLRNVAVSYDDAVGAVNVMLTWSTDPASPEVGWLQGPAEGTFKLYVSEDCGTTYGLKVVVKDRIVTNTTVNPDGSHTQTSAQKASAEATLDGFTGSVSSLGTIDGPTINVSLSNPNFAGKDYRCVTIDDWTLGDLSRYGQSPLQSPSFYFNGYAPKPPEPVKPAAQGCTRTQAKRAGKELLLPRARKMNPGYYRGIPDSGWGLGQVLCVDLTGDGRKDMVVQLRCCTGGALTPWGIFVSDGDRQWKLEYATVRSTTRRFTRRGRSLETVEIASYDGACTHIVRKRVVRWSGNMFRSRIGRAYDLGKPKRCA